MLRRREDGRRGHTQRLGGPIQQEIRGPEIAVRNAFLVQVHQGARHAERPVEDPMCRWHPRLMHIQAAAADVVLDVAALHVLGDQGHTAAAATAAVVHNGTQEGHHVVATQTPQRADLLPDLRGVAPALLEELPLHLLRHHHVAPQPRAPALAAPRTLAPTVGALTLQGPTALEDRDLATLQIPRLTPGGGLLLGGRLTHLQDRAAASHHEAARVRAGRGRGTDLGGLRRCRHLRRPRPHRLAGHPQLAAGRTLRRRRNGRQPRGVEPAGGLGRRGVHREASTRHVLCESWVVLWRCGRRRGWLPRRPCGPHPGCAGPVPSSACREGHRGRSGGAFRGHGRSCGGCGPTSPRSRRHARPARPADTGARRSTLARQAELGERCEDCPRGAPAAAAALHGLRQPLQPPDHALAELPRIIRTRAAAAELGRQLDEAPLLEARCELCGSPLLEAVEVRAHQQEGGLFDAVVARDVEPIVEKLIHFLGVGAAEHEYDRVPPALPEVPRRMERQLAR
mmetsp:Transcript_102843/g.329924  ORF Transcript_102843/g.329924 Transcript_102843/m.329924 type:complete len:511 (-) Transcript_102843:330-1862(-)